MDALTPVEGDPFAPQASTPASPPTQALTPVQGDPFAKQGAAPLTPVEGDPFVQDKPEAGLTPVTGDPFRPPGQVEGTVGGAAPTAASQPQATPADHWGLTRGLVNQALQGNPELAAYGFEAISHSSPDFVGEPLRAAASKLKELSTLSPEEYKPQAESFFKSLQGGVGPTMTFLGESIGSGIASTAVPIGLGLGGAALGGAGGAAVGGPAGAAIGATGGAAVGATSGSYLLNTGELYKALIDEKIDPKLASQYALAGGVPMAALDVASVGPIIARLGGLGELKRQVARDFARRIAAEGAKGAGREGATEAAQEAIKIGVVSAAADKPFWSVDNVDAIVGSGVGGGLVGGAFGGVSGMRTDRVQTRPPTEQEVQQALQQLEQTKSGAPATPAQREGDNVFGGLQASQIAPQEDKWYFSQAARTAAEKLPNTASPQQMLATLENSPGVKQEELEALRVPEFLEAAKGPVSKNDLIAHLEDNAVNVETVQAKDEPGAFEPVRFAPMGDGSGRFIDAYGDLGLRERGDGMWQVIRTKITGEPSQGFEDIGLPHADRPRAEFFAQQMADRTVRTTLNNPTQFGEYTTPGGENYREVKLTLPASPKGQFDQVPIGYQSPHFEEPNIVAHFRAKDRYDAEGKRGLGIEEIQSDWHQARREGEKVPDAPFKTSWPELALKRILRMAADEGYERVLLMPASEQIRRYGLRGKEAQGMVEFYDKIVPRLMEKWAKKLGGKTGVTQISTNDEEPNLSVRYLDLSPEMQTRISRGLPLFSLTGKGVTVKESVAGFTRQQLDARMEAMRNATRQAAVPIGQIAKRMGIDAPIALQIENNKTLPYLGQVQFFDPTQVAGNVPVKRSGVPAGYQIHLNIAHHGTIQEVYATLAHEFGHIIHRHHWQSASNITKLKIQLEYERWRESVAGNDSLRRILASRDNFVSESYNSKQAKDTSLARMSPEVRNYWLSFDEWFAEQVAKWMTTDAKPLSVVDKFFSALARKMRELYRFFSTRFGDIGTPEKFVAEFLDSLMSESQSTSFEVTRALENRTKEINRQAMVAEGAPEFPAEPFTSATMATREMLSSMAPGPAKQSALASAAAADRFNKFYQYMLSMVQLADRNLHIPGLQNYRGIWQNKQLERSRIMDEAQRTLKGWRKLPGEQRDAVAGLIDDYMNLEFLTPQEKKQGVIRRPTQPELTALVAKHKVGSAGLGVFTNIVLDFDNMLSRYGDILVAEANKIQDPIAQGTRLQAIGQQLANLRKAPYFPAMRFGDLTLTIYNAANQVIHFETFENNRSRKGAVHDLTPRLQNRERIQLGVLAKEAKPFVGMPSQILELIGQKLSLSKAQQDALEQLKFEMAPAQSFKHRFQHKRKVKGYSTDFMRAYANYFFHGANYFTNVKYIDPMRQEIRDVRETSRQMTDGTKRGQIANFMGEHLNYMMDPKADWAALRALGFLWYLGYVPAAAFINLSQVPMLTYPHLASKFGDGKSVAALTKAGAKLSTFYKKSTLENLAVTDRELRAISEGVKQGVITEAQAPELAAIADGMNLSKGFGGNAVQRGWHRFMEYSSFLFEMAEQTNRRVTFRAAFNLATENPAAPYVKDSVEKHKLEFERLKAEGWTDADASAFVTAKDAVETTQFIYQPYARARFMRGKASAVFLFKSFLYNTLFTLLNNPSAMVRSLLVMGLLGGAMGLPGAEDMKGVIKAIAWLFFGKDLDIEEEARRALVDLSSPEMADLALHGGSRYGFGFPALMSQLGVPAPELDLSRSIGLGQVLPVDLNRAFGPGAQQDPNKAIASETQRASGAIYGLGFNLWKAINDSQVGDYAGLKRWEKVMPREMASLSRTYRTYQTGEETDKKGNRVVGFDMDDSRQRMEVLALALGYQPLRLTRQWDRRIAEIEALTLRRVQQQDLLNQFWAARESDEARQKVREDIFRFNDEVRGTPAAGYAITADTLKRSMESRARAKNASESGTPRIKRDIPIVRDIQRLYPEADVDVRKVK